MCFQQILKLIFKSLNCIKSCCNCFKMEEKYQMKNFQKVYENCVDKPYGIMSFEVLVQLRMLIESTRNPAEKAYYRLLEDFIKVLDYLCHVNGRMLLINYVNDLNEKRHNEKSLKYKTMLKLTLNSLKVSLKSVDKNSRTESLKENVIKLENTINNFAVKYQQNKFIENYCKILFKLPKLGLVRRGLDNNMQP